MGVVLTFCNVSKAISKSDKYQYISNTISKSGKYQLILKAISHLSDYQIWSEWFWLHVNLFLTIHMLTNFIMFWIQWDVFSSSFPCVSLPTISYTVTSKTFIVRLCYPPFCSFMKVPENRAVGCDSLIDCFVHVLLIASYLFFCKYATICW